jgi:uncharacterized protein
MTIQNVTNQNLLSDKFKFCKSSFSKSIGLMFSKRPKTLIFIFNSEKKVPIHMMFVFFPIDIIFLDKDKLVTETVENLMPFSFYNPRRKSKFVIEMPAGLIKKSKTKVGDHIKF